MNNEEEVDEIMQYRKEFMEFLRETNFIEIMTHEDIESALIVARGWLNNQKTYFQSARYGQKQFVKFVATQFCWRMKDEQIKLLEKALELCKEADSKIKSSALDSYETIELLLIKLFITGKIR